MLQVSKQPSGQKGEQNRSRDGSDGNHIDYVVRGHRECEAYGRASGSPLPSCALIFVMPALLPKTAGQAAWQPDPDAFPVEFCPRSASHHGMASNLKA